MSEFCHTCVTDVASPSSMSLTCDLTSTQVILDAELLCTPVLGVVVSSRAQVILRPMNELTPETVRSLVTRVANNSLRVEV